MTTQDLAQKLTRSAMASRLGVGLTAISNATVRGKFPPAWFSVLKQMADEAGEECPMCLFAFVEPVAPQKDGDPGPSDHPEEAKQSVSQSETASEPFTAAR